MSPLYHPLHRLKASKYPFAMIALLLSLLYVSQSSAQSSKGATLFPASPNPTDDKCLVRMFLPDMDDLAELHIVNSSEVIVDVIHLAHVIGIQSAKVDLSAQPPGSYSCQLVYKGKIRETTQIYHSVKEKAPPLYDSTMIYKSLVDLQAKFKELDGNLDIIRAYNSRQDSLIQIGLDSRKVVSTDSLIRKVTDLGRDVIRLRLKLESFEQLMRELTVLKVTKKEFENPMKKGNTYKLTRIYFSPGNADFVPKSKAELDDLVSVLKEFPTLTIKLMGHTDNVGSYKSNMEVSKLRAKMVYDYLVSNGIDAARLSSEGYGPNVPFTDNITEEDKANNRRVEFVIVKE